jgi:cytochrome c5
VKRLLISAVAILLLGTSMLIAAPNPKSPAQAKEKNSQTESGIAEGEQRYRANCSRCHQAPPKFAPAAMGTLIRHMRVRAMLTEEDTRAILRYMTQ